MSVKGFYDEIAEKYDSLRYPTAYERRVGKLELHFIEKYLPRGRCLEVGSGTGRVTQFLVRHFQAVTAVDISAKMLEQLRANLSAFSNLTTYHSDVYQLNGIDGCGKFDAVISLRVLPHLEDPMYALKQLKNAVTDGGVIVIDLWNSWGYRALLTRCRLKHLDVYTDYVTPGKMRSLITEAGLKILDRRGFGFPPLQICGALEGKKGLPLEFMSQRIIWVCQSQIAKEQEVGALSK